MFSSKPNKTKATEKTSSLLERFSLVRKRKTKGGDGVR